MKLLQWKKQLRTLQPEFRESLEFRRTGLKNLSNIAFDLRRTILYLIKNGSVDIEKFLYSISSILDDCDNQSFDDMNSVAAYAHVHFLERYRRFWNVSDILCKNGLLPLRTDNLDILDIGTGPAPVLYASNDYYSEFISFFRNRTNLKLSFEYPKLECVEKSGEMKNFFHLMSELSGRKNGPYYVKFNDFRIADFQEERINSSYEFIEKIANDLGISNGFAEMMINKLHLKKPESYRYSLVVFSNFLTTLESIDFFKEGLVNAIKALRFGGTLVIIGGTDKHYPIIYEEVDKILETYKLRKSYKVESVQINYDAPEFFIIKEYYQSMYSELSYIFPKTKEIMQGIKNIKDLWNPDVKVNGPKKFGMRIYRKLPNKRI